MSGIGKKSNNTIYANDRYSDQNGKKNNDEYENAMNGRRYDEDEEEENDMMKKNKSM